MSFVTTRSWPSGGVIVAASSVSANAAGSSTDNGANSFAISANSPSRRVELELELVIGRNLAEFGGALAPSEPVEHRVDERWLLAVEKVARKLDIFVDHDLGRDIAARHQLV